MTSSSYTTKVEATRECLDSVLCMRYQEAENSGSPLDEAFETTLISVPRNSILSDNRRDPPANLTTKEALKKLQELDQAILVSSSRKEGKQR